MLLHQTLFVSEFRRRGIVEVIHVLVVEDDMTIASGIVYSLEQEQFKVTQVSTVKGAKAVLAEQSFGLCLLDISLPDGSGYEVCRVIKAGRDVPVIFLTACDDEVNIVMGLDMGADDYITKPFRIKELISRINSVLRRYHQSTLRTSVYRIQDISVNVNEAKAYKGSQEIFLTALEYRMLLTFIKNQGQILTRAQLLEGIWDVTGDFVNDNTLTVYIKRLREKLEDSKDLASIIQTIRGLGYRMGDGHA